MTAGTNVPSPTFSDTGFVVPSSQAVLAGVIADVQAAFGNKLNLSAADTDTLTTPQGQLAVSMAAIITNTYQLFQLYTQLLDPAYSFGRYQDAFGKSYVRGSVWAKSNAMGQLTGDRPATAFEGIAWLHGPRPEKVKKRWNGRGSYGIWSCNGTRGKKGRHPNEKPLDLALKLVALCSERGETIFDPFCGSAAIGEACVRLGRGYIGLDFDPIWVARARERLASPLAPMADEQALSLCAMWGRGKAASG